MKLRNNKGFTGIDIAASIGTDIVSSIDGKVIEVSNEGNYGKHIKIASNIDEEIRRQNKLKIFGRER